MPPISRIPRAPRSFWGLMNLRGRAVTVIETSALLLLDVPPVCVDQPQGRVVLLERERHDLGLLVSEVQGIHPWEDIGQFSDPVVALDATDLNQRIVGLLHDVRSKF